MEGVSSISLKSDRNSRTQQIFYQIVKASAGNRWTKKKETKENKQAGAKNDKRSKQSKVEHEKDKSELYHQEVQESRTDHTADECGVFSGV